MTAFLRLASDFIEGMTNPALGVRVNEDQALRFAECLKSEGFESQFLAEVRRLRDPDTLSSFGWLWLLNWAKAHELTLEEDLLFELCETWPNVFFKSTLLDHATRHVSSPTSVMDGEDIHNFSHRLIARLMVAATEQPQRATEGRASVRTKSAEQLLVALLQTGHDLTLDAARLLLRHPWPGQVDLLVYYWSLCDELDQETVAAWTQRIQPPRRP